MYSANIGIISNHDAKQSGFDENGRGFVFF